MKKVGLQLYTLRENLKTEADIISSFKKVKEIGYDIVQISGCGVKDTKVLRKLVDDAGLISNSVHENYDRIVKETEAFIEDCGIMGYKTAAVPWLGEETRSAEGYKAAAKAMSAAGEKLLKHGIELTYHNHGFEFQKFGADRGIDIIYRESNPKFLQSELDVYWVQAGGGDPVEWIRKMQGRAPIAHIKEMGYLKDKQIMLPIGEGNLNWKAIFAALEEAGTKYYYVEQDDCNGLDPFACVKKSLDNLARMGIE
ncbi:MAG: sugar phosphate isomerase/epimerase [Candidatus Firestonebacteria bacterium]